MWEDGAARRARAEIEVLGMKAKVVGWSVESIRRDNTVDGCGATKATGSAAGRGGAVGRKEVSI